MDAFRLPIHTGRDNVLALGGELKNRISIFKNGHIITSQNLGDMQDPRNIIKLLKVYEQLCKHYSFEPSIVLCDLHPDFQTTRIAQTLATPIVQVQHHAAHVLAVTAEKNIDLQKGCIGIAFDGTGYGEDGKIWGGEFFVLSGKNIKRVYHFRYVPQPTGDLAARQPWRMALGYLMDAVGTVPDIGILEQVDSKMKTAVIKAIEKGINTPYTSSVGRLFDAVSAITGIAPMNTEYEAEAAVKLESMAADSWEIQQSYQFQIRNDEIDIRGMIREIINTNEPKEIIAARFHFTLAQIIKQTVVKCRNIYNISTVILSGGVFLNKILFRTTVKLLEKEGFELFYPERLSPGDDSISVGQIMYYLLTGNEN